MMDNQDSDFLKTGQISKKIYEAPQIQDLDSINQTTGKNFLGPGELDTYTGTVIS